MEKLTDSCLMPFGKHKGEKMANVPASYLLFIYKEGKLTAQVKAYIDENMDFLKIDSK